MLSKITIDEKMQEINNRPWTPVEVACVNDQVVRMALCRGDYHWHKHAQEDELFFVVRGKVTIQLENEPDVFLEEGNMLVVPKGINHCPKSDEDCYVLVFEPLKTVSSGD
jgi:quercetin dioxygenase-like cupin family protein